MPNNIKGEQDVRAVSWNHVKVGVEKMAQWVKLQFGNNVTIYGIPRGGLIPAVMLVHKLEAMGIRTRFTTDLNHLLPSELLKLVIVDEVADSGDTMLVLIQLFPMAKTAVLYQRNTENQPGGRFVTDFRAYHTYEDYWLQFPWEIGDGATSIGGWVKEGED